MHARDLRRRLPDRPTIDGVDLDVHFGTVVALLGQDPSATAGLVRALHGEDHRVRGDLLVADPRELIGCDSARRRMRHITRAVERDVPLLLLVDPFRGLDPAQRETTVGLLREAVSDQRRAVVLSTTEIDHARHVADRIDVFEGGRIDSRIPVDRPTR